MKNGVRSVREHALELQLEFLQVLAVGLAFELLEHQAAHLVEAPVSARAGPERHAAGRQESGPRELVDRDRGASARGGFPVVRRRSIRGRRFVRGKLFGFGIVGIWLGVLADQISRFTFASIRYRMGKWVKIKI